MISLYELFLEQAIFKTTKGEYYAAQARKQAIKSTTSDIKNLINRPMDTNTSITHRENLKRNPMLRGFLRDKIKAIRAKKIKEVENNSWNHIGFKPKERETTYVPHRFDAPMKTSAMRGVYTNNIHDPNKGLSSTKRLSQTNEGHRSTYNNQYS